MDTIAFWLAVMAYVAVWCAIFSSLAGLIHMLGGVSRGRARTVAFSVCYLGAVLAIIMPLLVVAVNNPFLRFSAEVATAASHERCSSYSCSTLLAVLERP